MDSRLRFNLRFALLLLIPIVHGNSQFSSLSDRIREEQRVYQKYLDNENQSLKMLKTTMDSALKEAVRKMYTDNEDFSKLPLIFSEGCMNAMYLLLNDVRKMKMWPFLMLESMSPLTEGGIMTGTFSFYGSRNQCLKVKSPVAAQYCLFRMQLPLPPPSKNGRKNNMTFESEVMKEIQKYIFAMYSEKISVGICLPSTCNENDLDNLANIVSNFTGLYADASQCEVKEGKKKMDDVEIFIIAVLAAIIILNIICTIIDELYGLFIGEKSTENWLYFARMFSMRRNWLTLLKTRPPLKVRSMDSMNGIKCITCAWIVLAHSYVMQNPFLLRNGSFFFTASNTLVFQVILGGFVSVSSFILISSILISYSVVTETDKGKSFSFFKLIIWRIWRLLPPIILITGLTIIMPFFAAEGPNSLVKVAVELGRENWWKYFLFVFNLFGNHDYLSYLWYLSVDFQCLLFAVIYLYILYKNEKIAKALLVVSAVSSITAVGIVTYIKKFPPTTIINTDDFDKVEQFFTTIYMQPYAYLSVYCVGLYLGTFIARTPNVNISTKLALLGWILSIGTSFSVVYGIKLWNTSSSDMTMTETFTFACLHRVAWGLSVSWVILSSFYGRGGWIKDFLSWSGFQPLVKITYEIYLIHALVYMWFGGQLQGPTDAAHNVYVVRGMAVLLISQILAAIVYVMFSSPLNQLRQVIFGATQTKPRTQEIRMVVKEHKETD